MDLCGGANCLKRFFLDFALKTSHQKKVRNRLLFH